MRRAPWQGVPKALTHYVRFDPFATEFLRHSNPPLSARRRRERVQQRTTLFDDPLGRIDAVDLKHVLGDIQTDCGDLHVDGSLM